MNQSSPEHIMQVGLGFWASKTLLSAIELQLFTELAKQPLALADATARIGLHPRASRDFLDTLVALGFLERSGEIYTNTADTGLFLDKSKPSYIGGMLEMANVRLYRHWGRLTEALRTGEPQNEIREGGDGTFDALYSDPDRLRVFLRAMTGVSHGANMAIARKFPFSNYKSVVDVGPAQGDLIAQIALANPNVTGVGFDLPAVGPIFEDYIAENGLAGRVKFQAGSFFDSPIPSAEVITMGHILHEWDLETKKMLIRKAYAALPKGGALVVYESIIDDDRRQNAFGLMMSLNMLIETPGGFDYTGADCTGWMQEAGFHSCRVEHLVGPDSMVVGIK
jgi:2-polyprenyl-3-methyl-5-hydroxy-6-metoxy-1,4-benzoquinol methylase